MDWLRCNRCFRAMAKTTRSFSMTQCGHVFCNPCVVQLAEKCSECGSVGFQCMELPKPPELAAKFDYFSPIDEFMELSCKMIHFQQSQMTISVRGDQQINQKYMTTKIGYVNYIKENKEVAVELQKLKGDIKEIQQSRESRLQLTRNVPAKVNKTPTNFLGYYQEQQNRRTQEFSSSRRASNNFEQSASGFSAQYREAPHILDKPRIVKINMPEYSSNPSPAFSNFSYHSVVSTSDSGLSSVAPNSGGRVGGFLVPSIQRVPKSAATVRRKTPTGARLSAPKSSSDF